MTKGSAMIAQEIGELEKLINTISASMGAMLAFALLLLGLMIFLGIVIAMRVLPIVRAMTERKAKEDEREQQRIQQDAENMMRLIEFTGRLTVAIDTIATGQKAIEQASKQQTDILSELVDETRAMRVDLKSWPELTTVELRAMKEQIAELEKSVNLLVISTDRQRENIVAVETALTRLVDVVQQLVRDQAVETQTA